MRDGVDRPDNPNDPSGDGATTEYLTDVDLTGLMAIVSSNLYSTPLVAVRELVQNAHDAIIRRQRVDLDQFSNTDSPSSDGDSNGPKQQDYAPQIRLDVQNGQLTVSDNGEGMTAAEIKTNLGVVAQGVTGATRQVHDDGQLIGQFGVGFLSAFVLGHDVVVDSLSVIPGATPVRYRSADGLRYQLDEIDHDPARLPGTTVRVTLSDEGVALATIESLRRVVKKYCQLLRIPVWVGDEQITVTPPWRPDPAQLESEFDLETTRHEFAARFEGTSEPLAVIPVTTTVHSDVEGMLWVRNTASYATSDNRKLSVYVRGMLLDDDARDLLPEWAGMIGGVIESAALSPTASREDLQRTEAFTAAQTSIESQLIEGLHHLATTQPNTWRRIVRRHNEALIGAALASDELFSLLGEEVEIPTSEGPLRPSALAAMSRPPTRPNTVHVSVTVGGGFEEVICRCLGIPVARGLRFGVMPFLSRWAQHHGASIVHLGDESSFRQLFTPAEMSSTTLDWLTGRLVGLGERIEPARFAPPELPLVSIPDRNAELKQTLESDEADRRIPSAALALARNHTASIPEQPPVRVVLNLDNPTVAAVIAAYERNDPNAPAAAEHLRHLKVLLSLAGTGGHGDLADALSAIGSLITADLSPPGKQ